jgi:hypothetical protein
LARHPWQITLREFLETIRREYGIEVDPASAAVTGGGFLRQGQRPFPVPVMELDEVMPIPLLRFLCKFYRMPAADFGLDAEDDD